MNELKLNQALSVVEGYLYPTKIPGMLWGPPGIGKSEGILQACIKLAEKNNRKFLAWSSARTREAKLEVINNAKDYFVFVDIRLAGQDPTVLGGIPNMADTTMLSPIYYDWIIWATQQDAAGFVFLDEVNKASDTVQAALYQGINERVLGERRLGDGIWFCLAGNRSTDGCFVHEMSKALLDRVYEMTILPCTTTWLAWARQNGVHPLILTFGEWKPSALYKINEGGQDKDVTFRGIVRASNLLKQYQGEVTDDMAEILVAGACGTEFATLLSAYFRVFAGLKWDQIFADPRSVREFGPDKTYACMGGIVDMYTTKATSKDKFKQFMEVSLNFPEEYTVTTIQMMVDADKGLKRGAHFKKLMDATKGEKIQDHNGKTVVLTDYLIAKIGKIVAWQMS